MRRGRGRRQRCRLTRREEGDGIREGRHVEGVEGRRGGIGVARKEGDLREVHGTRPRKGLAKDRAVGTDRLTTEGVEGGGVTVHTEDKVVSGQDGRGLRGSDAKLGGNTVSMREEEAWDIAHEVGDVGGRRQERGRWRGRVG